MSGTLLKSPEEASTSQRIRARIEGGGERLWRYSDFEDLPPAAVAQTLSRLTKAGELRRAGKGLYYRPRSTVIGESRPSPSRVAEASARHKLHPTGISAANALGYTTQNSPQGQYATTGTNRPTKLAASKVATRRPAARESLGTEEGALLEFLRARGSLSELSIEETADRLLRQTRSRTRFARLARAASSEPPRVRAMLGALGEETGQSKKLLETLRASLNPLSRFDFGHLRGLPHAKDWQAK